MCWHINYITDQRQSKAYNGKDSVSFYMRLYEGPDKFMRGTDPKNASLLNSDVSFCHLTGTVLCACKYKIVYTTHGRVIL